MSIDRDRSFTVALLRGYDRAEVDRFVERATAGAVDLKELRKPGFTVVWRGYARPDVDAFVGRRMVLAEVAASARTPGGAGALPEVALVDIGVIEVLRGYRREDVDKLVMRARAGEATAAELRSPDFVLDLRGYERGAVEELLGQLADAIETHGPDASDRQSAV